jgi:hypothetical protein
MSQIINNLQYKEFFTEPNNNDTEEKNEENNEEKNEDNIDENNEDNNDENTDSNTIDNNQNKNIDYSDESLDETDDDELDEGDDPENNELEDSLNVDEEDDDELSEDDMTFNYSRADEKDTDIFIDKNIDPNDGLDLDERLTDLDINEDDDENIFTQGGSKGQAALDKISAMQEEGDELAELILSVPMSLIELLIDTIIKLFGSTFEKPINLTDQYLQPIRSALNGLYLLLQPVIQLIDNFVGLPFAIGALVYSTFCNIFKSFGVSMGCRTNYKVNHIIQELFDALTTINPFKLKDFFFNEEFRNIFIKGIKDLGLKILETFILILKAINTISKIIEYLINQIKNIVELIEKVTKPENLKNFLVVIITIILFYIVFFVISKYLSMIAESKEN